MLHSRYGLIVSLLLFLLCSQTSLSATNTHEVQTHASSDVIDAVNDYTSYFGGSSMEWSFNSVIDGEGNLIIAGETLSSNLPTLNAFQENQSGNGDAFLAKFNPENQLVFSTYLGGNESDAANYVCVDSDDNILVVGQTDSFDFPILNAIQEENVGDRDGTISKFAPNGTLLFSTYFGGTRNDWFFRAIQEGSGDLLFCGSTTSPDLNTSENALQTDYGGQEDVYFLRFSQDGKNLKYCSYFGSPSTDLSMGLQIDNVGDIVFTASVRSDANATSGAFQTTYGGGTGDILLGKLNPDGTELKFATLLGGNDWDFGGRIGFDAENNIVVTGYSVSSDYPVEDAFQDTHGGIRDAIVTKINPNGSDIIFSTFVGGSGEDQIHGGVVLEDGSIIISGYSSSHDFPSVYPIQSENAGYRDGCIIHLNADGQSLRFSTLIGGGHNDALDWVDVDDTGRYVLVGYTTSDDIPVVDAFQSEYGSGRDVMIVSIIPPMNVTSTTISSSVTSSISETSTSTTHPSEPLDYGSYMIIGLLGSFILIAFVVIIVWKRKVN